MGFPCTRERRLTICISKRWILRESLGEPSTIFHRALMMTGEVYWCAPSGANQQFFEELANKRGLPKSSAPRHLLNGTCHARLQAHEEAARENTLGSQHI
jgi:hypothetical protein